LLLLLSASRGAAALGDELLFPLLRGLKLLSRRVRGRGGASVVALLTFTTASGGAEGKSG